MYTLFGGEDAVVSFSVPMGSRCEACCANLSAICSVCFASGKMNHTIPIILLRAMLHLFFSSGMITYTKISQLSHVQEYC